MYNNIILQEMYRLDVDIAKVFWIKPLEKLPFSNNLSGMKILHCLNHRSFTAKWNTIITACENTNKLLNLNCLSKFSTLL